LYQQVAEANRRAEEASATAAEAAKLRQCAESPGGEVWVEVDQLGRVTGVEFRDSALRLSPSRLSEAMLGAIKQARQVVGEKVMGLFEQGFGNNPEMLRQLRQAYQPDLGDAPGPTAPRNTPSDGILRPKWGE
jgi:uncharacterized protein YuzE